MSTQATFYRRIRLEGDGTLSGTQVVDHATNEHITDLAGMTVFFEAEAGHLEFPRAILKHITNLPATAEEAPEDWEPVYQEEPAIVIAMDILGAHGAPGVRN